MSCDCNCDCEKDKSFPEEEKKRVGPNPYYTEDTVTAISEGLMDAITLLTLAGLQGTITLATNDGPAPFVLDQVNLHRPYGVDAQGFPD